jgi:hypothetical protein
MHWCILFLAQQAHPWAKADVPPQGTFSVSLAYDRIFARAFVGVEIAASANPTFFLELRFIDELALAVGG